MEHSFWHEKWQQNQIGFHKQDFHLALQQEWSKLKRLFRFWRGELNNL